MTTTMMPARSLAALATIAALVSGCMVGPDYVRPTAPEAPAFKEASGWKLGEPKDLAPRGAWWDAFADPDLDALVQQVAADNLTVQVAAARVREAQASVRVARAPLWPAIGATGQAVRRSQTASPGVSSVSNNYNAAIDLSWELDLWGGIRRGIESSEATAQASQARSRRRDPVDASAARTGLSAAARAGCRNQAAGEQCRGLRDLAYADEEPVRCRRGRARRRGASRGAARVDQGAAPRCRRHPRAARARHRRARRQATGARGDRAARIRTGVPADSSGASVGAARAATRHRRGRAPDRRRQCAGRRRPGSVLPVAHALRPSAACKAP